MTGDDWMKLVSMLNGMLAIWNAELLYINWRRYSRPMRAMILFVVFMCTNSFLKSVLVMFG